MGLIVRNDFSAGLCPSDSYFNGRDNAFLRMDNCYLDENGSVRLIRGNTQLNLTPFIAQVNDIFSQSMQSSVFRFVGLANGTVLRDSNTDNFSAAVTILSGGSSTRTRFGVAFGNVLIANGTTRVKDNGTGAVSPLPTLGLSTPAAPVLSQNDNIAGNLRAGTYQYIIVWANEGPNYTAKSAASAVAIQNIADAGGIPGAGGQMTVQLNVSGYTEAQATHFYVFRFGGTLNTFYFVGKVAKPTLIFNDNVSDATALLTNITLNQFLVSLASLTDEIIQMAGPIQGRMLYMTYKQIIISDQYNIDAYDTRKVIQLSSGSGTTGKNLFMAQFPLGLLYVGTTEDIYEISGTFSDLPDGTIDVFIRPFGVRQPPVNETFAIHNTTLFYMAMDGVRSMSGVASSLVSQDLRLLLRPPQEVGGFIQRYGAPSFLMAGANTLAFRMAINNNRLYVVIPELGGTSSTYIYYIGNTDGSGRYWYRSTISPTSLFSEEDGSLLAGFSGGLLEKLDDTNSTTFAGAVIPINLVAPYTKNELNQRKDLFTIRFHSIGGIVNVFLVDDQNSNVSAPATNAVSIGTLNSSVLSEQVFTINATSLNLKKRFSLILTGTPSTSFTLVDWSIDYNARPEPMNFLRLPATNYGLPGKKRLRTIPFIIDTLGQNVNVNAIIDGVSYGNQVINTSEKTTAFYFLSTDIFGTDIILTFASVDPTKQFEYYDTLPPVNVETLPVAKLFDQIGPFELERVGALLEFRMRMVATGTSMSFNVFMDDVKVYSNSFTTIPNVDKSYGPIKMPRGIQGSVCRLEFSSANVFYRWNCKPKFTVGGIKSDTKQITIQDLSVGVQK